MYSFACKLLEIGRNPCKIREILECFRVEGCPTNVKLFKVVLNLCREARIVDEGFWVLRKMNDFSCRPDTTMYNVVIGLFCERGDLDTAMGLMREMESCNLCLDMITFMSMLKGLCYTGRLEDACHLFKTMKNNGYAPNIVAYSALLMDFLGLVVSRKHWSCCQRWNRKMGSGPLMSLLILQSSRT